MILLAELFISILVFYSGHGDQDNLLLSPWSEKHGHYCKYPRDAFTSYFNGKTHKAPTKINCYKLFFMDACRGDDDSVMMSPRSLENSLSSINGSARGKTGGNAAYTHPEKNTCIFSSNWNGYKSYEVPYDEDKDDLDFVGMEEQKFDSNGPYCGVFMNSVYGTFKENKENEYGMNLSEMQDKMREKADGAFPLIDDPTTLVGQTVVIADSIQHHPQRALINPYPICIFAPVPVHPGSAILGFLFRPGCQRRL